MQVEVEKPLSTILSVPYVKCFCYFRILIILIPYFFPKKHITCEVSYKIFSRLEASLVILRILTVSIPIFYLKAQLVIPYTLHQNECIISSVVVLQCEVSGGVRASGKALGLGGCIIAAIFARFIV